MSFSTAQYRDPPFGYYRALLFRCANLRAYVHTYTHIGINFMTLIGDRGTSRY
jgi:hypothetical protein